MFFTICYVYATIMQWWRIRSLGNKIKGTLNNQNAILVCSGQTIQRSKKQRSFENLLFKTDNRIACTVVPKQKVNLNQWIAFPKNPRNFPIFIKTTKWGGIRGETIYFMLQAVLDQYTKHQSEIIQIEKFGELIGWKAIDCFEVILKTDFENLTKLIHQFAQNDIDINHELKLLAIETVEVEGTTTTIKYEKKYLKEQTLKYSYAPIHWNQFVTELKDLYSKIRDITNPTIKIENGTTNKCIIAEPTTKSKRSDDKKDKDKNKTLLDDKDRGRLDVGSGGDHRRHHKHEHHKTVKSERKTKDASLKAKEKDGDGKVRNKLGDKAHRKEHKKSGSKLTKQSSVIEDVGVAKEMVVQSGNVEVKPPNVLVYADSVITKDNVKRVLYSILNKEKYTIYDLPTASKHNLWSKTTVLVVVCGSVPPDLTSHLIQYLLTGGQLLCLCSDLMYSILHTFTTAEVREHELVRFSYGAWQSVKMMHHIFCYQASPAKKQFSKDSDQSNHSSNGSSPVAPRPPSTVELRHNERDYYIQVQVLGTEETWQTPSVLMAKVKGGHGRAVFSQVHLEIDPVEYENDEEMYRSLLSSNDVRLEILKDILANRLELNCDDTFGKVEFTPGYFLGRFDAKMGMVGDCKHIVGNQLMCDKINVVFCGHNVEPGVASDIRLPVLIHSCPVNFSTFDYFETLSTEDVGRLVIYSDILTSTQNLITKQLRHGLVIIAKQQTGSIGRSTNCWISPIGSAAFSLQLHIPLDSILGQALPLIQHLVIVAIVSAIRNMEGYENVNLGIKWPNDLYADLVKIGGIIISSTILGNVAVVNIGAGVNLSNQNPTTCINNLIDKINIQNKSSLKPIRYEQYFALVFNEIERLYSSVQKTNVDTLYDLYYKYWLHSNAVVTIQNEKGDSQSAKIVGIDDYGFLTVRMSDGTIKSVQPDGNSFDMMNGLIAPKTF